MSDNLARAKLHRACYSFGYRSLRQNQQETFFARVRVLDAVVVDIRWNTVSGAKDWTEQALRHELGANYLRLSCLGNRNYAQPARGFDIPNLRMGVRALEILLEERPAILMCACEAEFRCHRSVVLTRLQALGINVKELELTTATNARNGMKRRTQPDASEQASLLPDAPNRPNAFY